MVEVGRGKKKSKFLDQKKVERRKKDYHKLRKKIKLSKRGGKVNQLLFKLAKVNYYKKDGIIG